MKSIPLMFHRGNRDVLLNMHSKLAVLPTMAVAFSGPLVVSTPATVDSYSSLWIDAHLM